MADPLSVIASAISTVGDFTELSASLRRLYRSWKDAPTLILILANESADLEVVILQLQNGRESLEACARNTEFITSLDRQLQRARGYLEQLQTLTADLTTGSTSARRKKWILRKKTAAQLQSGVREVRISINDLLVAHSL
jgi:hypothetical protein